MTNLDNILKSKDITLLTKVHIGKAMVFPVVKWKLDHKKAERRRIDAFELWCFHPKGNQSWIFIGRTDAEAKAPILWSPDVKNWLIWKDPDAGKDWRQEEKGTTEGKMFGWHHRFGGHEFEQALGDGEGQGSLVCFSLWGHKEWDRAEHLNWTKDYTTKQLSLNSVLRII